MTSLSNDDKKTKTTTTTTTKGSVHVVVQRYRGCRLLVDEREWKTVGQMPMMRDDDDTATAATHCGILVYTSFAQGTTLTALRKAALTLIQMPLGTWGHWQQRASSSTDGGGRRTTTSSEEEGTIHGHHNHEPQGRPQSLIAMMRQQQQQHSEGQSNQPANTLSLVLCPQANLVSQVKRNGKSVQYHGQCDKARSAQYFTYLAMYVQALLMEEQCTIRQEPVPEALTRWKQLDSIDTALVELADHHAMDDAATTAIPTPSWCQRLQAVTVVAGSFGKRQGVELSSDMGPFCHSFQV